MPSRRLERAFDEAAYLRLDLAGSPRGEAAAARACWRRCSSGTTPGSTRTRSELEERMLSLCDRFRLPTPEVNVTVQGYEVDFVWRDRRLIVEVDGWAAHGTRRRLRARSAAATPTSSPPAGACCASAGSGSSAEPVWVAERLAEALAA